MDVAAQALLAESPTWGNTNLDKSLHRDKTKRRKKQFLEIRISGGGGVEILRGLREADLGLRLRRFREGNVSRSAKRKKAGEGERGREGEKKKETVEENEGMSCVWLRY